MWNGPAAAPGSLLISQFAWRAAPGTGGVNVSVTNLDVYLSTTSYAPNNFGGQTPLTNNFTTNLGPDNTLVYSGAGSIGSAGCAGPSVCPFDMVFTLTTPFLYNPANGKLLLDLQLTGFTSTGGSLDAQSFIFPPGGSVASLEGGGVNFGGNIVQFGFTLVTPEPASWAMMLIGTAGLGLLARRRAVYSGRFRTAKNHQRLT